MPINNEALEALRVYRALLTGEKSTRAWRRSIEGKALLSAAFKTLLSTMGLSSSELAHRASLDRATVDRWRNASNTPQEHNLMAIQRYILGEQEPGGLDARSVATVLLDTRWCNLVHAIKSQSDQGVMPTLNQVTQVAAFIMRARDEVGVELITQLLQLEGE